MSSYLKTGIDLMSLIGIRSEVDKEITCSSPLTVRFIIYALNPSVLIVCVTAVTKYMSCDPAALPLRRPPTWWKLITLQDHCQTWKSSFWTIIWWVFFFLWYRKKPLFSISQVSNLNTRNTFCLNDWSWKSCIARATYGLVIYLRQITD